MCDYSKALEYYTKSLDMRLESMVLRLHMQTCVVITILVVCMTTWVNIARIATSYNNIGCVYKWALEYYTKSLDMLHLLAKKLTHTVASVLYFTISDSPFTCRHSLVVLVC
ncbi:hypothetical protein EB796_012807 [Bugula neritina]|uniref:Uncharacterized protein n=1 Tax=Bugula neritina TaxID=10212 RepID=A0A7J7JTZ1_BUGNE|nr:hypothetical protein EB796_012807 [Bugula neritina]